MSLNAFDAAAANVPALKTVDQFLAWRTRVLNKCWATTGRDVSLLSDEVCIKAVMAENDQKESDKSHWVGKCWLIITGSLHDDLLMKVAAAT